MGTEPYNNVRPQTSSTYRQVCLKRIPSSRDGHTGIIYKGWLIVFGGDRYCMPFNDTFVYNIQRDLGEEAEAGAD